MSAARPQPTPATVVRHELIGLTAEVVDDACADRIGLAGRVVDETTQTLLIERERTDADATPDAAGEASDDGAVVRVPKATAHFAFALPAGRVRVDGDRLVARPAERSETEVTPWR
jgi:ribonuclease P protein subunit POP4